MDGGAYPEESLAEFDGGPGPASASRAEDRPRPQVEEELRRSEERYRTLLANIPVGVFRSTADDRGALLSANPALARMFGYASPEEMADVRVADLYADPADRRKFIETVSAAGAIADFEVRFKRADGRVFWGSLSAQAVGGPGGKVASFDGIVEDITARKEAEEALRRSEEFNRAAIERSPLGISVRSKTGKLLSANKAWRAIWGVSERQFQDDLERERPALTFDERDSYLKGRLAAVKRVYEEGGYAYIPELEVKRPKAGGARWVSQYFYALQDERGAVDRVVILTEDITARKGMELERDRHREAAAVAARDLQAIFENVDVLLWSVREDEEGQLRYEQVNDAFAEVEGKTPDYYNGRLVADTATAEQYQAIRRRFDEMQDGWPLSYEVAAGEGPATRYFVIQLIPLGGGGGGVKRFIGSATDVTESRDAEKALARHVRTVEGLNGIAKSMSAAPDVAQLLKNAAFFLADNPGVIAGAVYLYDDAARALKLAISFGPQAGLYNGASFLAPDNPAIAKILASTKPSLMADRLEGEPGGSLFAGREVPGVVVGVSLRGEAEDFGLLTMALRGADVHTMAFLELVGTELGGGIERKRGEEELAEYRRGLEDLVAERTAALAGANENLRREITERERAEETSRYFSEFIEKTIENTQVGIYAVDGTGIVKIWNLGMEAQFGVDSEQVVGKNIFELFPALNDESLGKAIRKALADGEATQLPEVKHRTLNKGERILNTMINALHDADGTVAGAVVITEDVTGIRQTADALRASEERYRSLVETIHEGFIVSDGDEHILLVNDAFGEILGYAKEELVGASVLELVPEEERAKVREMTRRKKEAKESTKYELKMAHKDGERRTVRVSSTPLLDRDGNYSLTIGVATDITVQKKTEAELALRTAQLAATHRRADELLRNILPEAVIAELEATNTSLPRLVEDATIVFVDFVGFSHTAAAVNHKALLTKLSAYFHTFDLIVKDYGLEKLKTVGDGYMFAGGLFAPGDQLEECARAVGDILRFVGDRDWRVRAGVAVGPCIAGLVKGWRMIYDVWGATVNLASRLEEAGEPGRVNVSEAVYERLRGRYDFEERGEIPVRNLGPTPMYFLRGPKSLNGSS